MSINPNLIGYGPYDPMPGILNPYFFGGAMPLDGLQSGLVEAHAVHRRLLSSYGGPLIRVRRDSDNAEEDIGYLLDDGSGVCPLDTAALSAFVSTNSAYIVTVYDEVGSADKTQSNTSLQPRIVNAGVLDVDSLGNAMARFDGAGDVLPGTHPSLSAGTIIMRGQARGNGFWSWTGEPSTGDLVLCLDGSNKLQGLVHNVAFYEAADTALSLNQSYVLGMDSASGGTATYFLDGVDDDSGSTTASWSRIATSWGWSATNRIVGGIVASVVWGRRLSPAEHALVAAGI